MLQLQAAWARQEGLPNASENHHLLHLQAGGTQGERVQDASSDKQSVGRREPTLATSDDKGLRCEGSRETKGPTTHQ